MHVVTTGHARATPPPEPASMQAARLQPNTHTPYHAMPAAQPSPLVAHKGQNLLHFLAASRSLMALLARAVSACAAASSALAPRSCASICTRTRAQAYAPAHVGRVTIRVMRGAMQCPMVPSSPLKNALHVAHAHLHAPPAPPRAALPRTDLQRQRLVALVARQHGLQAHHPRLHVHGHTSTHHVTLCRAMPRRATCRAEAEASVSSAMQPLTWPYLPAGAGAGALCSSRFGLYYIGKLYRTTSSPLSWCTSYAYCATQPCMVVHACGAQHCALCTGMPAATQGPHACMHGPSPEGLPSRVEAIRMAPCKCPQPCAACTHACRARA